MLPYEKLHQKQTTKKGLNWNGEIKNGLEIYVTQYFIVWLF